MADTLHIDTHGGARIFDRLGSAIQRLRDARARRRAYVTTFNELARLSDRELNDLGIGRQGIRFAAWDHAYGDRA